jgi:hypothetical protein
MLYNKNVKQNNPKNIPPLLESFDVNRIVTPSRPKKQEIERKLPSKICLVDIHLL